MKENEKKKNNRAASVCGSNFYTHRLRGPGGIRPSVSLEDTEDTAGTPAGGDNILIAYFSVPETDGTDTVAGASRVSVGWSGNGK